MRMKRHIVAPSIFGSRSQYAWSGGTDGEQANFVAPHLNYCEGFRNDYSIRVWEPGRNALSTPGVYGDQDIAPWRGPEIPAVTTIHGIKGQAVIVMGAEDDDLGTWLTTNETTEFGEPGTEVPVTTGDAWWALTGTQVVNHDGGEGTLSEIQRGVAKNRRQAQIRIPMFCCMYRGTYKQIDAEGGWEIDSGPPDDPATLLGVDITNPSVLESARMDWWDVDYLPLPRAETQTILRNDAGANPMTFGAPGSGSNRGWHTYALNLSANKVLGPDQVLWLHWATGVIRVPDVPVETAEGMTTMCLDYIGHRFHVSVHASALTSARLSI